MDDRERIARLEETMDAHRQRFDRVDKSLARLGRKIADLRGHTDRGFGALRADILKLTRWMIGINVTLGISIVGLLVKAVLGS